MRRAWTSAVVMASLLVVGMQTRSGLPFTLGTAARPGIGRMPYRADGTDVPLVSRRSSPCSIANSVAPARVCTPALR